MSLLRRLFRCSGGGASLAAPIVIPDFAIVPAADAATTTANSPIGALNSILTHGKLVSLGNGDYNPSFIFDLGFQSSTNPGTFTGSNYITFKAATPQQAKLGRVSQYAGSFPAHYKWQDVAFQLPVGATATGNDNLYAVQNAGCGPALFSNCTFTGNTSTVDGTGTPTAVFIPVGMATAPSFDGCTFNFVNMMLQSGSLASVTNCLFLRSWNLCIQMRPGLGATITDNFFANGRRGAGAHCDCIDMTVNGMANATYSAGDVIRRNIMIHGDSDQTNCRTGIISTDFAAIGSGVLISNSDFSNNIFIGSESESFHLVNQVSGTAKRNTVISDRGSYNASLQPQIWMDGCGSMTVTDNITELAVQNNSASSANTIARTLVLDRTLNSGAGSHAATFFAPVYGTSLTSASDVRRAFRPILNGPAKNADGTYMGALFPDGTWNDGTVFAGSQTFAG